MDALRRSSDCVNSNLRANHGHHRLISPGSTQDKRIAKHRTHDLMPFQSAKDPSGATIVTVEGQLIVANRQDLKSLSSTC